MKKQKKVKLNVGDIWGVPPLEKTLEFRTIRICYHDGGVDFVDIGGESRIILNVNFRSWITRKKAVLIGHYNFETGKTIARK